MATAPQASSQNIYPDWQSGTSSQFADAIGGYLEKDGTIQNTFQNWYTPQTAGFNQNLQGAFNAPNTTQQWQPWLNQAQQIGSTGVDASQGALSQVAQFNPSNTQQFMNPYTTNVVNEQARLSNQNLFENVLPNVNSTFTGAGQFGSTRNADFMNRAIRDQQYNLAGQQGNTLMQAQNQAMQQQGQWADRGINAGSTNLQADLSQSGLMQQLSQAGAGLSQQDWQNQMTSGQTFQDWAQSGSDRDYNDWLKQQEFPLQAMGALGQIFKNTGLDPDTKVQQQDPSTMETIAALLSAYGSTNLPAGALDQIKSLLNLGTPT